MKKVIVLNGSKGVKFGLGERTVEVSDKMTVADAETIQAQYPGIYVAVVDEPALPAKTDQTKTVKPAETTQKAEVAK